VNKYQNLIGGNWISASDGATFKNVNPADTNDVIGTFPSATRADVERAITAAREAFPAWAATPAPERGAILEQAGRIVSERLEDMARALTREEGKTLAEARGEITRTRDLLRYWSGAGWRMAGDVLPSTANNQLIFTRREPLGVIGVITPWNFPSAIPGWKIAPALAYGNTVVFKPASYAPHSGLLLVEALVEAGLPPGVINFVTGSGSVAGDAIAGSADVNGITFTGSYSVGKEIYQRAVEHMTRIQLEMGGKNPLVVLDDADVELATKIAVVGGFGLTGQACTASSRVIALEAIASDFVTSLSDAARNMVVGDGLEAATQMGPAVSAGQLETDLNYIRIGQEEGALLVSGGARARDGGYYVQPTVFDDVQPQMRIAQEEIFGPVIGVIRARNIDEAIEFANGISFGLAAGVVTNDLHAALSFAERVEAGVVKINEPTSGIAVHVPFGGFKQSSANTFKEQGEAAIEFYTRTKSVYLRHG
jgi:acyl-CoA reductase-like NAD-dependent aldehyde dehydrogenase